MYYKSYYQFENLKILLLSTDTKLIGVFLENQKYYPEKMEKEALKNDNLEILVKTKEWLDRYFSFKKPSPYELELAPNGSSFQKLVWEELIKIPYGKTTTYGEIASTIAQKLGKEKMSSRAVGNAIGHNPISIIVPCHRVIGKNKKLTGYAGGLAIKRKLLKLEGSLDEKK